MTEIKHSTSPQEETIQRAVWVGMALAGNTLLFLGLCTYLVITTGTWQSWTFFAIVAVYEALNIPGVLLLRRGRLSAGGWLLLVLSLLSPILDSLLFARLGYAAAAYIAIASFFIIRYVLPKTAWRLAIVLTSLSVVISILLEAINPAWRQVSQIILVVSPLLTAALGIAFLAVIGYQAWGSNIRLKIITAFMIVALVSLGILGTVTYINFRNQVRQDIRQRLINIASITATQQDAELHATIRGPEDMEGEAYRKMMAQDIEIISTDPDLVYIYTMRKNDKGEIYFVIDAQWGEYKVSPVGTVYEGPTDLLVENFDTLKQPIAEEEIYTDEFGSVLSAYAPVFRADGTLEAIVGVDIGADKVLAQERSVLIIILGTSFGTMLLVTLLGLFLGNVFTKPIIELSLVAQKISEGDLSTRAEIGTADEIGDLARTLNTMTSRLQETLQGLEERVTTRTRDLATVAEVGTATATILETKRLLQEVTDLTKERFNLYHSHIYLLDETGENLVLAAGAGEPGRIMVAEGRSIPVSREQSLVARAARERKGVTVNDVTQAPDFLPNPLLPNTRSELAVPMLVGPTLVGVFDIQSDQIGRFTESDITIQTTLAAQLATSIQNVRQFEQSKVRADLETMVNTIGQKIQRTSTVEETLQTAIRELGLALGASQVRANLGRPKAEVAVESEPMPEPEQVGEANPETGESK